jgi:hypothetical protein
VSIAEFEADQLFPNSRFDNSEVGHVLKSPGTSIVDASAKHLVSETVDFTGERLAERRADQLVGNGHVHLQQ